MSSMQMHICGECSTWSWHKSIRPFSSTFCSRKAVEKPTPRSSQLSVGASPLLIPMSNDYFSVDVPKTTLSGVVKVNDDINHQPLHSTLCSSCNSQNNLFPQKFILPMHCMDHYYRFHVLFFKETLRCMFMSGI